MIYIGGGAGMAPAFTFISSFHTVKEKNRKEVLVRRKVFERGFLYR
jgi:Na+-transporting NADH:ubiquinone oxidoreductase subunit NqrF